MRSINADGASFSRRVRPREARRRSRASGPRWPDGMSQAYGADPRPCEAIATSRMWRRLGGERALDLKRWLHLRLRHVGDARRCAGIARLSACQANRR